jgi:hypothetical protein
MDVVRGVCVREGKRRVRRPGEGREMAWGSQGRKGRRGGRERGGRKGETTASPIRTILPSTQMRREMIGENSAPTDRPTDCSMDG